MKKQTRNTRGPGAWVLGSVASVLMCMTALGQYSAVGPAVTINDNAPGSPYPSTIDLTKSNILGNIEKVTVTLNNVKHGYANDVGVLLVAPDGSNVVLMRNAGGGQPINGANLTFDDSGAALPQFSAISTGTFAPGDFDSGVNFLGAAPAGPYGSKLSGLVNATPNGKWSLYVEDDSPLNTGSIDSWTLNLYTTPLLSLATNYVNLNENGSSSNLSFTLQDSSVANYTVSFGGAATNNLVIASGSVSGLAGTVTLTPKLNAFGTNTLTVFVSDGLSSVQSNVTVAVLHINQAPTIAITNASLTTVAGVVSPVINAVVADVDPDNPASSLSISVSSSNTNLVDPAGVFFDPANSGGLRTFTVVPRGNFTGSATLTFTVKDAGNLTGTATLPVTITAVNNPTFASTNLLGLSASGTTNSSIVVSNVSGAIGNLSVAVSGLKTVAGNNLSLALVPPGGAPITLVQNAGSTGPNTFAQLSFSASTGGAVLPGVDTITAVPLKVTGLSALVGTNPNGTWTLWATNGGAAAQITGGWVLNLMAAPTITSTVTSISMPEQTSTNISFVIADIDGQITNASDVTITSADPTLISVTGATFDTSTGNGSATLNAIFTGPQFGKTTVTVTAKDNNNFTVSLTYNVTVTFVNHAPTISFIVKQITRAGTPLGPVSFTVGDVDQTVPLQTLTVTASSSDQKILPDSNIQLGGSGNNRSFTVFPVGTNSGDVQVTLNVSDGIATTSETFTIGVLSQGNPLFVNLNSISVPANADASPYPSTIAVSNLLGTISKVEVTLFDITHSAPDNMNALLVSPDGTKVLLMGHAGGANPLANTTIDFSDTASGPLPDSAQIVSGTYQPSSYGTVAVFDKVPAGPTNLTLAAFNGLNGTNANGLWSLYITDDGLGKGVVVNGWQLSIQTAPFVSQIADVTLKENDKTLQIPVSLGDDQPGVNITASAVSANPGVVTASFEAGTGGTRTLDITPVPFQIGSNIMVTVTATSGAASSTTNFHVTVYQVSLPPVLSSMTDVSTPATTQSPTTSVTAWDPQDQALTVSASSSDTKLIPNANIFVTGPTTVGTTNGHNLLQYGVSVRSADADVTGSAVITVTLRDTGGQSSSATFNATITKGLVFLNTDGPISIPEGYPIASNATPYPSIISVSNLDGLVTGAKVTLLGFSHGFPQDVDVLLVSPDNSKSVVLMAHVGGGTSVSNLRLSFDDTASALTTGPLSSGTFAPTDLAASLQFATPAPTSGYGTTLASLKGVAPNGNWKLYVMDDSFPTGGSITGWMLTLQTGPGFDLTTLGPQRTPENTTKVVQFGLLDESADPASLVVTATTNGVVSPTNVLNLIASLQVTNNGGGTRTLIITPSANLPSTITNVDATTTVFLTVTDTNGNSLTTSFPVTVSYGNQAPLITTPTNTLVVLENGTITTTFTISDVDSTLYSSNLVVASTDGNLIANTTNGLLVTVSTNTIAPGKTGTVTVKVTPTANVFGTNTITVSMTDGNTLSTSTVTVDVEHVYQPPTISGLPANVTTVAGTVAGPISFTVGSQEGIAASSLTVTASSTDQTLVPNANIVLGGTDANRTIQLTPLGTVSGNDTINLLVGDGKLTNSYSFVLKISAPPAQLFGNGQVANIVGNATNLNSSPYPITFDVTNLVGGIFNVSLEMRGFSNSLPANLDALLVSPDGTAVMLTSGGGGTTAVSGLDLVFDDSGGDLTTVNPLVSGTYHPAYVTKRLLPAPAPQSGYASRMAAFASMSPSKVNGTWSLYLNDLTLGDFGKVSGGFYLTIVTKPAFTVTTTTPVIIPENGSSNVSFTISDSTTAISNLTVTATASDNRSLLPTSSVTITGPTPITSGNFVALMQPLQYQNGTANITITATRNDGASSSTNITVTVPATNFPPVLGRLTSPTTPENTTVSIQFLVSDVDTPLSNLVVKAVSANQAFIGDTNLVFSGSTNNANILYGLPPSGVPQASTLTLNMTPNNLQIGSGQIWVIVDDNTANGHNIVSNSFTLTSVAVTYPPTITAIPDQTVSSGGTTPAISFQVNSLNQPAPSLTVVGVSSDPTKVKNSNIVISPATATSVANRTVTITSEAGSKGPVTITLTVNDTVNNVSTNTTFTVNVLPSPVHTYANTGPITINDNSAATPYPSTNFVSGLVGTISKITVTLTNFAHHYPADVGVMLVGPNGQKVVLMNKAGGGNAVTNVNLTFDQSAASAIPQGTTLATGSYRPADYKTPPYNFFGPAPTGPYGTDLSVFNGGLANGTWSLWVQDDTPPDAGVINGGWSLNITTQPSINGLTTLVMQENSTNSEAFTIADDSPSGQAYRFGVSTTNSTLIPNSGVTISGSGSNYTVSVVPAAYKFGTNLVTIYATNIDNAVTSNSFVVAVQQVLYPPTIVPINSVTTAAGVPVSVPITYSDVQVPNNQLTVSFQSSNPGLIPTSGIVLSGNQIQVTPSGAASGVSTITVTVAQPQNQFGLSAQTTFNVTVTPVLGLFGTNQVIVINDRAPATPYPSTINVSGLSGNIVSAKVTVLGLQHTYPSDISMLLVGPQGQQIILMSRAGSGAGSSISGVNLTFDDSASSGPPQTGLITSGTYKPSDYNGALQFYAPVVPPYVTNLSVLKGTAPNGTWSLYVQDDLSPDSGQINGGWLLQLVTTVPTISFVGPQTTPENTALVLNLNVGSALTSGDKITLTAASSNPSVPGLIGSVAVSGPGTNAASFRTLTIIPGANLPSLLTTNDGTATITLTATDGTNTSTASFPITVTYVDQAPTLSGLSDQTVPANGTVSLAFTANDVDTPGSNLVVAASSSVSSLGNLKLSSSGNNQTLTFTPSGTLGQTTVTVTVSDGIAATVTNTFKITVTAPVAPVFGVIPNTTNVANVPVVLTLPVTDGAIAVTSLTYSGTNDNASLISKISFANSGTNVVVTIKPATNAVGVANVVITAKDSVTNASTSFVVAFVAPNPPQFGPISDVTAKGNTIVSVPLPVTDTDLPIYALNFSGTASNAALIGGVTFTKTATNAVASVHLIANQVGTSLISISVSDGFTNLTQNFNVNIVPPTPPTLASIAAVTTPLNTSTSIVLNVTSPDTALNKLTFSGSGTNGGLVKSVTFSATTSNVTATINVLTNRVGFDVVTITANDGFTNVSQSFSLTVTPVSVVKLGPIGVQNTTANNPAKVLLTVTDPDTSPAFLTYTGTSTNKSLVSNVTFSFNGKNEVAVVNLVPNAGGTDLVTINVTDGFSSDSKSFVLNVSGGTKTPPTIKLSASGSQLNLTFQGSPNAVFGVQTSSDLRSWTTITNITANSSGSASFTGTVSGSVPVLFYRGVLP